MKVALLNYIHGLTLLMDPADFVNTSDTRLAVSRIITWTTEPKSVDVRKVRSSHVSLPCHSAFVIFHHLLVLIPVVGEGCRHARGTLCSIYI